MSKSASHQLMKCRDVNGQQASKRGSNKQGSKQATNLGVGECMSKQASQQSIKCRGIDGSKQASKQAGKQASHRSGSHQGLSQRPLSPADQPPHQHHRCTPSYHSSQTVPRWAPTEAEHVAQCTATPLQWLQHCAASSAAGSVQPCGSGWACLWLHMQPGHFRRRRADPRSTPVDLPSTCTDPACRHASNVRV